MAKSHLAVRYELMKINIIGKIGSPFSVQFYILPCIIFPEKMKGIEVQLF
jgi:hypothetical protein